MLPLKVFFYSHIQKPQDKETNKVNRHDPEQK